jgi:endonuclease/exonuclease/phosphatase family metal-dependent hydrolase
VDGSVDPGRVARAVRAMVDPDVCCFQEVAQNFPALAGSRGEDQAALLAREFPGYEAHFGWGVDVPGPRGARSRFGNLIVSRLPVRRVLRHALPWPADPAVPSMPRIALEAVIEARWGAVRVTTTHLEYYSALQRAAQVERLIELQAEAAAHESAPPSERYRDGPFAPLARPSASILTGDFNMRPEDPLAARLRQWYVDAWQAAHPGVAHPPTFRLHDPESAEQPYCCDFVLVSGDLAPRIGSVRVDGATRVSDHQPVIVELR